MNKRKDIKHVHVTDTPKDKVVTIGWKAPWWRFWNREVEVKSYFGSHTVWRSVSTGVRCATSLELIITDIVAHNTFKKEFAEYTSNSA